MKKQLEAIREIEETNRRKPLAETLADIDSGKHWDNLRNLINAAAIYGNFARCTAEAVEGCNTILKGSFAAGYYA